MHETNTNNISATVNSRRKGGAPKVQEIFSKTIFLPLSITVDTSVPLTFSSCGFDCCCALCHRRQIEMISQWIYLRRRTCKHCNFWALRVILANAIAISAGRPPLSRAHAHVKKQNQAQILEWQFSRAQACSTRHNGM